MDALKMFLVYENAKTELHCDLTHRDKKESIIIGAVTSAVQRTH